MISYFWGSETHLEIFSLVFESAAAFVEVFIAVWIWKTVKAIDSEPSEENEHKKESLEATFALIAAVFVLVAVFSVWRILVLHNRSEKDSEAVFEIQSNKLVQAESLLKIATNDVAKIDPRNANISEISAVVFFTKMGMDLNELTNLPAGRMAQLSLWKDEKMGTVLDSLTAANGDISEYAPNIIFGTRDRRIYRMQFHSLNFQLAQGIEHPVKMLDDIHLVHIDLNFLPRDSEIGGASVELIVNNIHKMFVAPEQNDTNSNLSMPVGFPCWFVATNGIQSSPKQFLYLIK